MAATMVMRRNSGVLTLNTSPIQRTKLCNDSSPNSVYTSSPHSCALPFGVGSSNDLEICMPALGGASQAATPVLENLVRQRVGPTATVDRCLEGLEPSTDGA